MFGNNIKVHFAGIEVGNFLYAALAGGAKYGLYSPYHFIKDKQAGASMRIPSSEFASGIDALCLRQKDYRHIIQDSGLFTLIFNPKTKREITYQYLLEWQDKIMNFLIENRLNATAVEIDCQKILGVKEAWSFRERMRRKLPNRQINVFHVEDGKEGLNSLIDFSEYIAISVPEIRRVDKKTYKRNVVYLAEYIKNRKPEIDIHLLGCTELDILKACTFCTSADSTSWLSGVKYGWVKSNKINAHVKDLKEQAVLRRAKEVQSLFEKDGKRYTTELAYTYNGRLSICASFELRKYIKTCGRQD